MATKRGRPPKSDYARAAEGIVSSYETARTGQAKSETQVLLARTCLREQLRCMGSAAAHQRCGCPSCAPGRWCSVAGCIRIAEREHTDPVAGNMCLQHLAERYQSTVASCPERDEFMRQLKVLSGKKSMG